MSVYIWNRAGHEYSSTTGHPRSFELAWNLARACSGQVFYARRSGPQPAGRPPYYKRGAITAPDEEDLILVDNHITGSETDTDAPPRPVSNILPRRLFLSRKRLGRLGRANTQGGRGGAAGDALAQAGGPQEHDDHRHARARRGPCADACEAAGPRAPDVWSEYVRGITVVLGCAAKLFDVA